MNYGCSNMVAVISGGTSGIGLATALQLLQEGAQVFILGRSSEKGLEALHMLEEKGLRKQVAFIACDVSQKNACEKAVQEIIAVLGSRKIDLLVNSAGVYKEIRLEDLKEQDYREVFATNVEGVLWLSQAVLPYLQKGSSIINIASDAGISGNYGCPVYCASKGAVVALTRALALDLAPNTRVNCICPGDVDTPLLEKQIEENGGSYSKTDMAEYYPLEKIGTANEIAHVICSVASPYNSFMTGSIISVDGGLTAK